MISDKTDKSGQRPDMSRMDGPDGQDTPIGCCPCPSGDQGRPSAQIRHSEVLVEFELRGER